jgi:sec-independent protein translocase protein TatC
MHNHDTHMPTTNTPPDEEGMPLIEHLKELRWRLARAAIAVVVGMSIGLFLVLGPIQLIDIIITAFVPTDRPYPPLLGIRTTEVFTSYMTVALAVGIILSMPLIVYEMIAFVLPGLTSKEKRLLFIALPFVTAFFVAGLAFGWFVTVPVAIKFLMGFGDSELVAIQPALSDFLRIVTLLLLTNGVVFEMPVIIYVLALLGLVTAQQLAGYRRYALLVVTVVAAFITPTGDPVNLMLLAIPMYLLFEFGIVLARFAPKRS